jgi:vacuolar-type H+-ATPase subunit E/Vma4
MGLAEVRKSIVRSKHEEAEIVLKRAREEAESIIKATNDRIAAERTAFDEQTAVLLDNMEKRESAVARAKAKAFVLEAKRKAIDETFAEASQMLEAMEGEEREAFVTRLCEIAAEEIVIGSVRAAEKDLRTVAAALPKAKVAADSAINGGLVATDPQGQVSVDLTFARIIAQVYDKELLYVSEMLFGGNRR